jgi:hypothetical protein
MKKPKYIHLPWSGPTAAETVPLATEGMTLYQNYPNPFKYNTTVTFALGDAANVRLTVHDALGREVASITDGQYEKGNHSFSLRSGALPNGLYFYRLTTTQGVLQQKMLLMR